MLPCRTTTAPVKHLHTSTLPHLPICACEHVHTARLPIATPNPPRPQPATMGPQAFPLFRPLPALRIPALLPSLRYPYSAIPTPPSLLRHHHPPPHSAVPTLPAPPAAPTLPAPPATPTPLPSPHLRVLNQSAINRSLCKFVTSQGSGGAAQPSPVPPAPPDPTAPTSTTAPSHHHTTTPPPIANP